MRKLVLSLSIVLTFMVLFVPLASATVEIGPTSLEVWKEMEYVNVYSENDVLLVSFLDWIYIENVGEHPAYVDGLVYYIEAKWKNQDWTTLIRGDFFFDPPFIIAPGETLTLGVLGSFEKGMYKAYRNVIEIHLLNHPTGDRWFHYRESFEVPELTING